LSPELMARSARGHNKQGKFVANSNLQALVGCGGLHSTANDLVKYVAANVGLMQSPLTPLMLKMQVMRNRDTGAHGTQHGNAAMPWLDDDVSQPPGMELLGHGGGTLGYSAFVGFDKKQRRGIVVLSSQNGMFSPAGLGFRLLQKMPLDGMTLA